MDIRDISNVVVLKNCARTDFVGPEVIDGNNVSGVQIHAPLIDAGTAAGSYYGPGEVIIADAVGVSLDNTVTKATSGIRFHQRSYDGESHFATKLLKGANIKSYEFTPYEARSEQVSIIHTIDATLTDHSYMIKIRKLGSYANRLKEPSVKTAYFKSAAAGSTAAQIAAGLVDYINENFANDPVLPVTAVVGGAASDAVIITASAYPWELGKLKYERLKFAVELVNFDATIVNNMYADLTYNAITYDKATLGAGSYEQVAEMEYFAKAFTGANRDLLSGVHRRTIVPIDAQKYEDDGTTLNRYDTVVINWENNQGDYSRNVNQMGSIVLFLPLDDNTTNQQADVIATLNQYIVTAYGVGAAITLS